MWTDVGGGSIKTFMLIGNCKIWKNVMFPTLSTFLQTQYAFPSVCALQLTKLETCSIG